VPIRLSAFEEEVDPRPWKLCRVERKSNSG